MRNPHESDWRDGLFTLLFIGGMGFLIGVFIALAHILVGVR